MFLALKYLCIVLEIFSPFLHIFLIPLNHFNHNRNISEVEQWASLSSSQWSSRGDEGTGAWCFQWWCLVCHPGPLVEHGQTRGEGESDNVKLTIWAWAGGHHSHHIAAPRTTKINQAVISTPTLHCTAETAEKFLLTFLAAAERSDNYGRVFLS